MTADGTPKLLDFGIAKLLAAGIDPDSAPTATLLPMMTPEYASPEQVKGEPVTTASDVYSLGVLLYELLAGRRPYAVKTDSMEEIVRAVCQTEPPPPSAPVDARARDRSELKGDLDTIVMKALRKDPRPALRVGPGALRRTCGATSTGLPVRARPDTLRYRASKFVGRHRTAVAAAAVVLLALVGGLAATARQARIAERERALAQKRFHDVRRLSNSLIFELHDSISKLAGATEARKLLVQRAAEYLDLLAAEAPADDDVARDLAEAHERLADVLGGVGRGQPRRPGGAQAHRRKALAMRERLATERPLDLERQRAARGAACGRSARGARTGGRAGACAPRGRGGRPRWQQPIPTAVRVPAGPGGRALRAGRRADAARRTGRRPWPAFGRGRGPPSAGCARRRVTERRSGTARFARSGWAAIMIRSGRYAEAADHYGARAGSGRVPRRRLAPEDALARRDVSVTCVDLSDRAGASWAIVRGSRRAPASRPCRSGRS